MSVGLVHADFKTLSKYITDMYLSAGKMKGLEPDIIEYTCEQVDNTTRRIKQVHKLPWPLKNRTVSYVQTIFESESGVYVVMYDSNPKPVRGVVNTHLVVSGFVLKKEDEDTRVYRLVQLNPGGFIPASLTRSYAHKTSTVIQHLRKIEK